MKIIINKNFNDEQIKTLMESHDKEIIIDLKSVKFLSSKDISKLLILKSKYNKRICLINANAHIQETIKVLNLSEFIECYGDENIIN